MFLIQKMSQDCVWVYDTVDKSLESVSMATFCSYVIKNGKERWSTQKIAGYELTDIFGIVYIMDGVMLYSHIPQASLVYIDTSSRLVRILDKVFVIAKQQVFDIQMGYDNTEPYLYIAYNNKNYRVIVGENGVSIPDFDDFGILSTDDSLVAMEFRESFDIDFLLPFLTNGVKRRLLLQ